MKKSLLKRCRWRLLLLFRRAHWKRPPTPQRYRFSAAACSCWSRSEPLNYGPSKPDRQCLFCRWQLCAVDDCCEARCATLGGCTGWKRRVPLCSLSPASCPDLCFARVGFEKSISSARAGFEKSIPSLGGKAACSRQTPKKVPIPEAGIVYSPPPPHAGTVFKMVEEFIYIVPVLFSIRHPPWSYYLYYNSRNIVSLTPTLTFSHVEKKSYNLKTIIETAPRLHGWGK